MSRDPEERERRKALVVPLARAIGELSTDDPIRAELWVAASRMDLKRIHRLMLEALRSGDPQLSDDMIERQRTLVLERLPIVAGEALAAGESGPWPNRLAALLARWDLAPAGDAAARKRAAAHLEEAMRALEVAEGPDLPELRAALRELQARLQAPR